MYQPRPPGGPGASSCRLPRESQLHSLLAVVFALMALSTWRAQVSASVSAPGARK